MIIYKSDNVEKFNEILTSGMRGEIFDRINPRTEEIDLCFELHRRIEDILTELDKCPAELFDIVWDIEDTFNKMEDVYHTLLLKYDMSRKECKDLLEYLRLELPKNESGNSVRLSTWKKYRNKEEIKAMFIDQSPRRVYSDKYLMARVVMKGKMKVSNFIDFCNEEINAKLNMSLPDTQKTF